MMTSSGATTPRLGLVGRIRDWFRDRRRRQRQVWPVLPVSERRVLDEPIRIPADGGAFDFVVSADMVWSATGLSPTTLASRVDTYQDSDRLTIQRIIWTVGRRFQPHHPESAEAAMNEALGDGWCHDENGEVVSCRPLLRVTADDRVLARLRPFWERIVEIDARMHVERRRIDVTDVLLGRWRDLLTKYDGDKRFTAVHAAPLVGTDIAAVLRGLTDERRDAALDLATVLKEASNTGAHLGLYEFATSYDTALRGLQQTFGLPTIGTNGGPK